MSQPKNLFSQHYDVTPEQRSQLLRQRGCVLWFVGLSGAGKSTLANALELHLLEQRKIGYVLDGDNLRRGLNHDLRFTEEDRVENLRRVAEVARLFADSGSVCISAFISPFRESRKLARQIIGSDRFFEIFIATSLEVCEQRDTKGLYQRARDGDIQNFTGISSPFEPPESPDITIDTAACSVEESVSRLYDLLVERGMFLAST